MSFIEHLQDRDKKDLKQPVSHGYSQADWIKAYETLTDGSEEDRNIRDFGLFTYQRLERVRDTLTQLESQTPHMSRDDVVRILVRYLNEGGLRFYGSALQAMEGKAHASREEMAMSRPVSSISGGNYTPQEALEHIVDASRHVLRNAMRKGKGYGTRQPDTPVWEAERSLQNAVHLAQFYDALEGFWQRALWMGSQFLYSPEHQQYLFSDLNSAVSVEAAIDLARRMMKYQRDIDEVRSAPLSPRTFQQPILQQNASGKLCVMPLGMLPARSQEYALSLAYQRFALLEYSSNPLMDMRHGTVGGLTVSKVFDGWMQLSLLAQQNWLEAAKYAPNSGEQKACLGSPISRLSLVSALSTALGIKKTDVEQLIDYLTFDGTQENQSLWQRPLLNTRDGLLLVWVPLIMVHPMRLIAAWAREAKHLKVTHDKRGHGFEREVVTALRIAGSTCPLDDKPFILEPGLKVPDSDVGDIDGILVLGSTAFVLECRNLMHPATPYEYWSVARDLNAKVSQVVRKRDYLKANPSVLSDLIAKSEYAVRNRPVDKFVAVVISNSYLFEGASDDEPYFVHIDTLFNTILAGGSSFGDMEPNGNEITYSVNCFKPEIPSGTALAEAIAHPVKAEYYAACLSNIDFPIPALDQTEPFGMYRTWCYTPPEIGLLKDTLDKCSFADKLVVNLGTRGQGNQRL